MPEPTLKTVRTLVAHLRIRICWKAETEEFINRLFLDGKHQVNADYFTDSEEDAVATARHTLNRLLARL